MAIQNEGVVSASIPSRRTSWSPSRSLFNAANSASGIVISTVSTSVYATRNSVTGNRLTSKSLTAALVVDRLPEIQAGDVAHEDRVLGRQRLVKAKLLVQQRDRFRRGARPQNHAGRVAGDQVDHQKDDHRHQQHNRDDLGKAAA